MTTHQPSIDRSPDDETANDEDADGAATTDGADPADLLSLLGDGTTRRVLEAVADQPRSAREVVELADVSRVTAYRHLDRLEGAGLVDSATVYDSNGHHHAEYWAVCEEIVVEFSGDGVELVVQGSDDGSASGDG
ncbi:ArsR/SmtB family transcription factor [Halostella salina]|uniref:ArsR/SmtB family transcription factor n=1 Tax=Halostella salina TaxID=1547897 RepID=UPI000EF77D43|nr:winged helix-turn-helix domain-containing protein [Halostella salina]